MNSNSVSSPAIGELPLASAPAIGNGKPTLPDQEAEKESYDSVPARKSVVLSVIVRKGNRGTPMAFADFAVGDEE